MGGFPLACGAAFPFGVVGLLGPEGVPGLPSAPFSLSFCLAEGVDLLEEERLEGGLRSPAEDPPPPVLSRCSPLMAMGLLGGSSSLPTSTTRSPSLFSPPSDSCKQIQKKSIISTLIN